jgi:hypothetical protein
LLNSLKTSYCLLSRNLFLRVDLAQTVLEEQLPSNLQRVRRQPPP